MSARRLVVERFYAAMQSRDAAWISVLLDLAFDDDVVLRLPASLPYGGMFAGREPLRRMFTGLVKMDDPIVCPESISVTRLVEDGDCIVAEVSFAWKAPGACEALQASAIEWFTFREGLVVDMSVVYWDTAACVAELEASRRGAARD